MHLALELSLGLDDVDGFDGLSVVSKLVLESDCNQLKLFIVPNLYGGVLKFAVKDFLAFLLELHLVY